VLYTSQLISMTPMGDSEYIVFLNGLSVLVPDTFTFSAEFTGINDGDEFAGLLAYDPPTVGTSDQFYWVKNSDGNWFGSGGTNNHNFYAQVTAVPEPTTALLLASGLAGLAAAKRRRSRQ